MMCGVERLMGWPVWSVSGRGTGRAGRVLWDEGVGCPQLDGRREIQEEGCGPHQEEGVSHYLV